jgi:hypothetical protein
MFYVLSITVHMSIVVKQAREDGFMGKNAVYTAGDVAHLSSSL